MASAWTNEVAPSEGIYTAMTTTVLDLLLELLPVGYNHLVVKQIKLFTRWKPMQLTLDLLNDPA
jgi:hypothetical protein